MQTCGQHADAVTRWTAVVAAQQRDAAHLLQLRQRLLTDAALVKVHLRLRDDLLDDPGVDVALPLPC